MLIVEYIIDQFLQTMCQKMYEEKGCNILKQFASKNWFFREHWAAQNQVPSVLFIDVNQTVCITVEASITKLTFYHIRCFLLSKDAFTPNLAEFGPVTIARATKGQ